MNVNDVFPSKYVTAQDLGEQRLTVRIAEVKIETLGDERKPVLYFNGTKKGWVLAKTRARELANHFGPEMDNWKGHEVILYAVDTQYAGKPCRGIRADVPDALPEVGEEEEGDTPF